MGGAEAGVSAETHMFFLPFQNLASILEFTASPSFSARFPQECFSHQTPFW